MKLVRVMFILFLFLLISCENCERSVLFTYIYTIDIETSEINKHCSVFADGEPGGWDDYDRYFFSPDRNHFLKYHSTGNTLDYCDLESGDVINSISTVTEDKRSLTLSFSNSGDNIVFSENTIFKASILGDNVVEICDGKYPSFNPSDENIVFVDNQGYLSIYDLVLNHTIQLIYDDGIKFPIYHPNGDKIYYSSNNGIHVLFLSDTLAVNISNGDPSNCSTKFSVSDSGENKVFASNNSIYTINDQDNVIDLEISGKYPHVSHNGNKIIYIKAGTDSIYIMNFDGFEKTNLCYTPIEADNACFSEDDQRVFFNNRKWGMTDAYCDE